MKLCVLICKAILFVAAASASFAAPFANGSFESPSISTSNGILGLANGDTALSGWFVELPNGSGISLYKGNFNRPWAINPIDATQQIAFNDGDRAAGGSIYQDFDTVPGHSYTVSFYVARISSGAGNLSITATATDTNGATIATLVVQASTVGYVARSSFTFVPTTTTTRLRFSDTSTATLSVDLGLDAVSVIDTTAAVLAANIQFYAGITITGVVDSTYRVEFSDDLNQPINWSTLTTVTLITSPQTIYDTTSPNQRQRFYRVVPLGTQPP